MRLGHINLICAVNYPYLLVYSYFFLVLQFILNMNHPRMQENGIIGVVLQEMPALTVAVSHISCPMVAVRHASAN
jgi:hypothetical protein